MITAKINLSNIDKSRIYTNNKGEKSIDIALIETPNSKYGDYMVVQQISKEERQSGKKAPILGNGKNFSGGTSQQSSRNTSSGSNDDVPWL